LIDLFAFDNVRTSSITGSTKLDSDYPTTDIEVRANKMKPAPTGEFALLSYRNAWASNQAPLSFLL